LIKHPDFALPDRKELLRSDVQYERVLIDATEIPIKRPKKNKSIFYSGKKKRHTLKSQLVIDKKSQKIICTTFSKVKRHDFRLFKESKTRIHPNISILTNTGYQGTQKIHAQSKLPKKNEDKKESFDKR
jgi:DDE superfamily endonuclease